MSKLLAYRNFAGIGDWIMALSVLKMVNRQYPYIDIYLNITGKNLHADSREKRFLPKLTREIIDNCDVKIKGYVHNNHGNYDYVSGHMIYDKAENKLFIESMVDRFNYRTGLKLQYEPDVYVQCATIGNEEPLHSKPYILMQSCTKRQHSRKKWKDYGSNNMRQIAKRLGRHVDIIQVGDKGDIELPVESTYLGFGLSTLYNLAINSLGFVGMDGMLGVFAAHSHIRQYIIYSGNFKMNWTKFPNRMQINGNKTSNKNIARLIVEDLCAVNSEKLSFA